VESKLEKKDGSPGAKRMKERQGGEKKQKNGPQKPLKIDEERGPSIKNMMKKNKSGKGGVKMEAEGNTRKKNQPKKKIWKGQKLTG